MTLSFGKLLLILLIVLLVFGAGRLPRVMGDIGKGMRALRDGLKEDESKDREEAELLPPQQNKDKVS